MPSMVSEMSRLQPESQFHYITVMFVIKNCNKQTPKKKKKSAKYHLIFWPAEDKENAEGVENLDTSNDSSLAGMAETIAICWGGIKDQLDKVNSIIHYMYMYLIEK